MGYRTSQNRETVCFRNTPIVSGVFPARSPANQRATYPNNVALRLGWPMSMVLFSVATVVGSPCDAGTRLSSSIGLTTLALPEQVTRWDIHPVVFTKMASQDDSPGTLLRFPILHTLCILLPLTRTCRNTCTGTVYTRLAPAARTYVPWPRRLY